MQIMLQRAVSDILCSCVSLCFPLQSVEFHERGKNHKENVAAKITEVFTCIHTFPFSEETIWTLNLFRSNMLMSCNLVHGRIRISWPTGLLTYYTAMQKRLGTIFRTGRRDKVQTSHSVSYTRFFLATLMLPLNSLYLSCCRLKRRAWTMRSRRNACLKTFRKWRRLRWRRIRKIWRG